jgi:CCR4-NOT transcription complex subunit 2
VTNTHPLQQKIQSFSDETLFYIFYTKPRDVMQEIVAAELYVNPLVGLKFGTNLELTLSLSPRTNRNWRYHKALKQWLTKDAASTPIPLSENSERGFYVFFDPESWSKQRVSSQIIDAAE